MEPKDLKDIIAPSMDERVKIRTRINDYAYYAIIVIVSSLVTFIPPLLIGSLYGDLKMMFPSTVEGWIIWGIINGATSIGNVSILIMFKLQAKKNCRNNENFKKANEILHRCIRDHQVMTPRSPRAMDAAEYTSKGFFIAIGSVASFVAISSIVVAFDMITLISTCVSVLTSVSVSWATMIKNEAYWCDEYLLYAQMIDKKLNPELYREEEKGKEPENGERQDLPAQHPAASQKEPDRDRAA